MEDLDSDPDPSPSPEASWKAPPNSPLNLSHSTATLVIDPDTEIFDIYSLQSSHRDDEMDSQPKGLGFMDSKQDVMNLHFELRDVDSSTKEMQNGKKNKATTSPKMPHVHVSRRGVHKAGKKVDVDTSKTVEAVIAQDLSALRNRRGDTGSVVWRASVHLAERLLQQHHFPSPFTSGSSCSTTILNPSISPDTSLLELGAGTGLLPIFLSKLFDSWTVTDQFDNLKLIERNLRLNSVRGVLVEEVDWVEVAARPVKAKGIVGGGGKNGMISGGGTEKLDKKEFDIVLAVDCVYNEALVKPLVATLNEYAIPGRTVVWILVEMRSADVLLDFLETWMADPAWTIVRLRPEVVGDKLKRSFVSWVGWKEEEKEGNGGTGVQR